MSLKHDYSTEISQYIKENNNTISFRWGEIVNLEQIGQGGSGLVYTGKYNDYDVVLKFYNKDNNHHDFERFKNEYSNIQMLENHQKNFLASYINFEHIEIDGKLFYIYIMKKYTSTLKKYLKQYQGSRMEIYDKVLDFLLLVLKEIHAKNIIHRDLKPENILVDSDELFYLADFGIAKYIENNMTKKGERLANYKFSAPEQSEKDGQVIFASDIYSLGQLLYWVLEGHTLEGTSDIDDYDNPLIKPLLSKCLKYNQADRFQSIEEIELFLSQERNRLSVEKEESCQIARTIQSLEFNDRFNNLIRRIYPKADNQIECLSDSIYFERIIKEINFFIEENLSDCEIWYSDGLHNQTLKGITYIKNENILQLLIKDLNTILEFSLEKIWLYADVSGYTSLVLLQLNRLQPYIINGEETYHKSIVNGTIEVDTNETRSGYLDLGIENGEDKGVVEICDCINYERSDKDRCYYAIGPLLSAPIYIENDDILHDLQAKNVTVETIYEYILKIRRHKPKEFYNFQ